MKRNKIITIFFNTFILLSFANVVYGGGVEVPDDVSSTLKTVTRVLLLIGSAVCIGKVIHIGILYVTSSAMDKSNAKQAVIPWIIGTIVCFGAATIGGAVINVFLNAGAGEGGVLDY